MAGPRLGMSLELSQSLETSLETRQVLEPPDRAILAEALRLWMEKPHEQISFPVSILKSALAGQKPLPPAASAASKELAKHEGEIDEEFVKVSSKEMAELDPDEKVGLLLGDSVFIADETPAEYVPIVVLNLGLLRRLKEQGALNELIRASGVDMDTSRHWSANIVDIIVAEKYFGDDKQSFLEFLKWRKKVERTEFFSNQLVGDVLRNKLEALRYRRTTHPLERGGYARKSWGLAGSFEGLGKNFADEYGRDFAITKADTLIQRFAGNENFDPEMMQRLINFIETNNKPEPESRRDGHIRRSVVVTDPALDVQAYLLTPDISGAACLLDQGHAHNQYYLEPMATRSLAVLKDRIAFFYRKALMSKPSISPKLLQIIRSVPSASLEGLQDREVKIDLTTTKDFSEASEMVAREVEAITGKIAEAEGLLGRYEELERELGEITDVSIIPGNVGQEKDKILNVISILSAKKENIMAALDTVRRIFALRQEQKALLSSAVLDS